MPIYEYQCEACGHVFERLQKISEAPLTECPDCGAQALKKLLSAPAFRLKGGGWYETDFKTGTRKKNLEKSEKSEKKEKSATKTAGGDKSGGTSTTKKPG